MPKIKFLLAAASLLATTALINAATFLPTSPLIQIGDDTDIFFTSTLAFDIKDNLFSVADKKSAALVTFTPGFELEYAKDSPLSANLRASRSFIRYNKAEYRVLEQGQDNIYGNIGYQSGGPLVVGLTSSYNESARNDNLVNVLGADSNAVLGATLVRQANYSHELKVDYKLTEKINLNVGYVNSYNHYLNPVKTKTTVTNPDLSTYEDIAYNTNGLSEINTKTIPINITYRAPSEKLTYGLSFSRSVSDYSAAPYFHTEQALTPVPAGSPSTVARPALQNKFTQNFYGFTINGEPTSSGKLHITTRFGYFNSNVDGAANSGASYDLRVSHNWTERYTHEINLIHDVSPSAVGGSVKTDTISYTGIYGLSEKINLNFHIIKSLSTSGSTEVNSLDLNAGVNWEYNTYLKFSATIDSLDSKLKNSPSSNFKANSFNLTTSFRY
jgi:hypothetical protein